MQIPWIDRIHVFGGLITSIRGSKLMIQTESSSKNQETIAENRQGNIIKHCLPIEQ